MQQIAVNQMNGTSGGSLRQKLDLSDACQATDAFAMLFMQLMGQTIQPEALLQMQGNSRLHRLMQCFRQPPGQSVRWHRAMRCRPCLQT